MRYLFAVALIILGIAIIAGCTPRKIAYMPEHPADVQVQPCVEAEDELRAIPPDDEIVIREYIGEEEIARREIPDVLPAVVEELQMNVPNIHFNFDKYNIREDAIPIMQKLAGLLLKNRDLKVIIEGHTDERGTNEYNLALGDRRATSAKEHLVLLGVAPYRIGTISFGEERPLCLEPTEESFAKNRRAHFVILEGGR
ncbi:OmpA family protein [Thermodesulfovibrionales bacterium]|nr:OmpA family protein [Thermodesulfovibrionales bacterium]